MLFNVQYIRPHPKTGMLEYRRVIPVALRPHVSGLTGKPMSEIKRSLGARTINAPGVPERLAEAAAEYDRLVSHARKVSQREFDRLDPPLIRYLADAYVHYHLAIDEAGRWGHAGPAVPIETRRDPEGVYDDCRRMLEDFDGAGLVEYWRDWATSYALSLGYLVDPSTEGFAQLCRELGNAACKVWLAVDRRMDKRPADTPDEPVVPAQAVGPIAPQAGEVEETASATFRSIADDLLARPRLDFGSGVREHAQTALRFLQEALGEPLPRELTRSAVSGLLDMMAQRPSKLPAHERALPLPALADLYQGRTDVPRMSGRTQDVRMSALSTLWKAGKREGLIADGLANPFEGWGLSKGNKRKRKVANGFTVEELQHYFSTPIFSSGERPRRGRGETPFWLPLVALFTGARPEEVAQLLLADIAPRPSDGRWTITFSSGGDHPVKGTKTLKTDQYATGERTFPLPQPLIELGLLEYRQWLQDAGHEALFPLLTTKNKRGGVYSTSAAQTRLGSSMASPCCLRSGNRRPAPWPRPTRRTCGTTATQCPACSMPTASCCCPTGWRRSWGRATRRSSSSRPGSGWRRAGRKLQAWRQSCGPPASHPASST